jgi:hypothetical protein
MDHVDFASIGTGYKHVESQFILARHSINCMRLVIYPNVFGSMATPSGCTIFIELGRCVYKKRLLIS